VWSLRNDKAPELIQRKAMALLTLPQMTGFLIKKTDPRMTNWSRIQTHW
jgi:hypothetical protein